MANPIQPPFNVANVASSTDKVAEADLGKVYEVNGRMFQVVKAHAAIASTEVRADLTDGATLADGDVIVGAVASQSLAYDDGLNSGEEYQADLMQGTTVIATATLTQTATETLEDLVDDLNDELEAGDTGITVAFDASGVQIDLSAAVAAYQGDDGDGIFIRLSNIEDPEAVLSADSASTAGGADARANDPAGLVVVWQSRSDFTVNVTTTAADPNVAGFVPAEVASAIGAGAYFLMQLPRNRLPLTVRVDKAAAAGDVGKVVTTSTTAGLVTFGANTALTTATVGKVAGTAVDIGDTLAIVTV